MILTCASIIKLHLLEDQAVLHHSRRVELAPEHRVTCGRAELLVVALQLHISQYIENLSFRIQ